MSALVRADIKASSKKLTEILKDKYKIDIKHGHALEIISLALGARDWNTLSAQISDAPGSGASGEPTNIGELLDLIKSLPRSTPLYAEYRYKDDNFEHDGGFSAEGRKRTEGILAYKAKDGFCLEFEDARYWKTARETSRNFPEGTVQRTGDDLADEVSRLMDMAEDKLILLKDTEIIHDADEIIISQSYKFDELYEITEASRDLLDEYGVTWAWDKESGVQVSELDWPDGSPRGDREGLVDQLKTNFREKNERDAYDFFEPYGFSNQISNWESETLLVITAIQKIHDDGFEGNFLKFLDEVVGFNEKKEMEKAADQAAQMELDKQRGK
jgi:hypothetical protein